MGKTVSPDRYEADWTNMSHYKTNLRDIEFNLFEAYRTQEYLGEAPFEEMDEESVRQILREIDRLAREDFAASFTVADRTPVVLHTRACSPGAVFWNPVVLDTRAWNPGAVLKSPVVLFVRVLLPA